MPYMKKMIYSGNVLEIEIFPTTREGLRIPRSSKSNLTPASKQHHNIKNAKKKFKRLVECNFTEADTFITLTYKKELRPKTAKKLKLDFQNFIRRLKYKCKKENLPMPKYMAVSHSDKHSPHHHLIINAYPYEMIEKIWGKGNLTYGHLQRDEEYSFTAVSQYIMNKKNENSFDKMWCASQNLKKPKVVYKEIKRLNPFQAPKAPKGYKLVQAETTDNIYTGTHRYIRCIRIEE